MPIVRKKAVIEIRLKVHLLVDDHVTFEGEGEGKTLECLERRCANLKDTSWMTIKPAATQWEIRACSKSQYEEILANSSSGSMALVNMARACATPLIEVKDNEEVLFSVAECMELGRYIKALSEGRGLGPDPLDV